MYESNHKAREPSREVVKGKLMLNFNMLKRLIMGRGKRNYVSEVLRAKIEVSHFSYLAQHRLGREVARSRVQPPG